MRFRNSCTAALAMLALGGGLRFDVSDYQVRADYAWRHYGQLGSRNVFSVSLGWR